MIGALEDAEDYKAFEAAVIADYDAQSAVERELVLRLASLLWRLRRATTMETGLFEIQAEHLRDSGSPANSPSPSRRCLRTVRTGRCGEFGPRSRYASHRKIAQPITGSEPKSEPAADPSAQLARCFLRLANLPNYALDRLSRYEATLWRQARQILLALEASIAANHGTEGVVSVSAARESYPVYEPEE